MRTRTALLRAAAEVFAARGFAGSSVHRITKHAGVTLGALYWHFPSKEELAREIVRQQPAQLKLAADSTGLQCAVDTTLTWAQSLLDDPILLAGARLVMDQEYFVSDEQENSYHQWGQVIAVALQRAYDDGELLPGIDVDPLARVIVNACTGAQMHAQLATRRQDLPERIEEMWRLMLPLVATTEAGSGIRLSADRESSAL